MSTTLVPVLSLRYFATSENFTKYLIKFFVSKLLFELWDKHSLSVVESCKVLTGLNGLYMFTTQIARSSFPGVVPDSLFFNIMDVAD